MEHAAKQPSPERFWQLLTGFHASATTKTAVDMKIFTHIAGGKETSAEIAAAAGASERGIRTIADAMTVYGLLTKSDGRYGLTDDAALFLVESSPAYLGGVVDFMLDPVHRRGFDDLTNAVKLGGSQIKGDASLDPDSPMWGNFARSMAAMMVPSAMKMASDLGYEKEAPIKVLDIAASHGMFGLSIANAYPNAEIYGLDWGSVLTVARENAAKFGVADRYHTIEGDAFEVDLGSDYDVILITNFLHHFDAPTCERFLRRCHDVLKDDGQVHTLEFIPNDDRVSPPAEALFSVIMLANTPAGDAYTFKELTSMFENAGFAQNEHRPMPGMPQHWVVSRK